MYIILKHSFHNQGLKDDHFKTTELHFYSQKYVTMMRTHIEKGVPIIQRCLFIVLNFSVLPQNHRLWSPFPKSLGSYPCLLCTDSGNSRR